MDSLIFLMGLIIGALISYFYVSHSSKKRNEGEGNDLLGRTARAEQELRELRAELARCKQQSAQLKVFEEQCQQKDDECRTLAEKLASAESQLQTLQEPVKQAESEARIIVGDPHAEEPEAVIVQEPVKQTESEARIIVGDPHEEEPEPEPEPEPEAPQAQEIPVPEKPDDLRKIEGIGPKVAQHLQNAGIKTFAQLAQTEVERLREILGAAGPAYKARTPESWPEQAELAAKGDWDALKVLQARLDGGRYTS